MPRKKAPHPAFYLGYLDALRGVRDTMESCMPHTPSPEGKVAIAAYRAGHAMGYAEKAALHPILVEAEQKRQDGLAELRKTFPTVYEKHFEAAPKEFFVRVADIEAAFKDSHHSALRLQLAGDFVEWVVNKDNLLRAFDSGRNEVVYGLRKKRVTT